MQGEYCLVFTSWHWSLIGGEARANWGGALALWVHRVVTWGCKYGENLDIITVFHF